MKFKRAIIVGGSSGLGAELAWMLALDGCKVAIIGRSLEKLNKARISNPEVISAYEHDVRQTVDVPELFENVCRDLGGLDLIIYAAGVMPEVASDEFDTSKDRDMIETNFLGCVAWLNKAARRFQDVGAGTIVGIGSVAGDRGRHAQPVYNATKAALATYLEALRNRLSRHEVKVVTIKPGPIATPMTAHLDQSKMMPAETAARLILKKIAKNGEHYLKPTHWLIFLIIRHIPSPIFRRLRL
jgi:NAD(P)-dependent dehydrogenase (short-subunit alcohol dehydrogenase family)